MEVSAFVLLSKACVVAREVSVVHFGPQGRKVSGSSEE